MRDKTVCLEELVVGNDVTVQTLNGQTLKYVNFDNAASTPPLKRVVEKVAEFSRLYSAVHRGSGYKSFVSTEIYEAARIVVADFVGAETKNNSVIFVKNCTEAINTLAHSFTFDKNDIVISTFMEHHSNDLPWRRRASVKYINVLDDGALDMDHYEDLLKKYRKRVKLVAVTGASNVTGFVNPVHKMARSAHLAGVPILVDASQLIPHRQIDIRPNTHLEHIDFIVFSAHKIYSPFGIGVLIGPKRFFNTASPYQVGGGTVKIVTENSVVWSETPERQEAGTPNTIGAVALASALEGMKKIGWEQIEQRERSLTQRCLDGLRNIPGLSIYGSEQPDMEKRLGVIGFNITGIPHSLLAAILSYEYGIGVRNGCFCAHPYVLKLLDVDRSASARYKRKILKGDKSSIPGMVRVSFGLYNTLEEVDRLIFALNQIAAGKDHRNEYVVRRSTGVYALENSGLQNAQVFSFSD